MKTIPKIGLAILLVTLAYSCKQSDNASVSEEMTSADVVSSSAAVEKPDSKRQFIRTADVKFRVKNVPQSTYAIENATTKHGGFVIYTNLQSSISETETSKISQDSLVETTKYSVENNITIRVPNTQLDTVIKTIAKQIDFLDYRVIKADDVSLQLLSNELAQNRLKSSGNRVTNAIDSKGKKLNQIVTSEDTLESKKEQLDNKKIENLSLRDQVNFSTLTLNIYQRETVRQEKIANTENKMISRSHLGIKLWDSIKSGWFILEDIVSFIIQFWTIILIGIAIWIVIKKFKAAKK
ncbi:MAG: DUF4349 domain-containing protein [Flavobacterium sp.]|uniref:DUF4349 domain-containing protein n=1 Tax=Flavobacterium sp. TaxID=239 RepID=UPI0022C7460D|nr:DUF4349 domain-containing protein [Flavobacterium sp.]MCZ8196831.1 DUF4349 domain-containing protein [Flavobacterium sp.]